MDYLGRVVEGALKKNQKVAHDAKSYGESVSGGNYYKLLNLDAKNLRLVADELGATPQQFAGFLEVVKAIYNGGKVENEIYLKGFVPEHIKQFLEQLGQHDELKALE